LVTQADSEEEAMRVESQQENRLEHRDHSNRTGTEGGLRGRWSINPDQTTVDGAERLH